MTDDQLNLSISQSGSSSAGEKDPQDSRTSHVSGNFERDCWCFTEDDHPESRRITGAADYQDARASSLDERSVIFSKDALDDRLLAQV